MRRDWQLGVAISCSAMTAIAAFAFFCSTANQAEARPKYSANWQKKYPEVVKANDVEKKVKCAVCHPGGKTKMRNAYSKAIQAALPKKNEMDEKAILAAFEKAAAEKSETEGKTFGDLLKENKLPAKTEAPKE